MQLLFNIDGAYSFGKMRCEGDLVNFPVQVDEEYIVGILTDELTDFDNELMLLCSKAPKTGELAFAVRIFDKDYTADDFKGMTMQDFSKIVGKVYT